MDSYHLEAFVYRLHMVLDPVARVVVRVVDVVADKAKLVHRQPKSSSVWHGFLRNQ